MPETILLKLIELPPIPGAYIEEKRAAFALAFPPNFIPPVSKVLPAIFLLTPDFTSIGANLLAFGFIVF